MLAARGVLRFAQRLAGLSVSRRGCAGAVPVDDIVSGLTDEQIQVNYTEQWKLASRARTPQSLY